MMTETVVMHYIIGIALAAPNLDLGFDHMESYGPYTKDYSGAFQKPFQNEPSCHYWFMISFKKKIWFVGFLKTHCWPCYLFNIFIFFELSNLGFLTIAMGEQKNVMPS